MTLLKKNNNDNSEIITLFCSCGKLFKDEIGIDSYFKVCNLCNIKILPNKYDTLLYEFNEKEKTLNINYTQINKILKDPVEKKIKEKCVKCQFNYKKTSRIGINMKLIKICIKCKNIT